jgi:hypothetical protein
LAPQDLKLLKIENYEVRALQEDMWCFNLYLFHKNDIKVKVNAKKNEGKKEDVKIETKIMEYFKEVTKIQGLDSFFL